MSANDGSCSYSIKVIDKGIGMSQKDVKRLFTAYYETSDKISREMNQHGHGLGLHISHKIAEVLGYQIHCESKQGAGSTFTIKLLNLGSVTQTVSRTQRKVRKSKKSGKITKSVSKLEQIVEISEPELSSNSVDNNEKEPSSPSHNNSVSTDQFKGIGTIIVADDQVINLAVVKQHLEAFNLVERTLTAVNGQEAIDMAKKRLFEELEKEDRPAGAVLKPVSIMLLDLQMPIKNGVQVVQELRTLY